MLPQTFNGPLQLCQPPLLVDGINSKHNTLVGRSSQHQLMVLPTWPTHEKEPLVS